MASPSPANSPMPPPQAPSPMGPPSQSPSPSTHSSYPHPSQPNTGAPPGQQVAGNAPLPVPGHHGPPPGSGHHVPPPIHSGPPYIHPIQHGPHIAPHSGPQHNTMTGQQHGVPQHGPPPGQHAPLNGQGVAVSGTPLIHSTPHGVLQHGAPQPQPGSQSASMAHMNGPPSQGAPGSQAHHMASHHQNLRKLFE